MRLPISEADGESHLEVSITPAEGEASARILYLHGFGSSRQGEKADFFRSHATAAGLEFWSFDFQGHGESGGSMRELTLSRNLGDVGRVCAAMADRPPLPLVLLGSSMGGLTGLWYSAVAPEAVAAGLYVAPAVGLEAAFGRWAGAEGLERWQRDGVLPIVNELGCWELGWGFVEDLRRHGNEALASKLRTPSQFLQGKLDDRVEWREVADLARGCAAAGVELHLFEDGDHRLVDRKERLWELMKTFLRARGLVS